MSSVLDVSALARRHHLLPPAPAQQWGVASFCTHYLGRTSHKALALTLSQWDAPLSPQQKQYAALDALTPVLVLRKMMTSPAIGPAVLKVCGECLFDFKQSLFFFVLFFSLCFFFFLLFIVFLLCYFFAHNRIKGF